MVDPGGEEVDEIEAVGRRVMRSSVRVRVVEMGREKMGDLLRSILGGGWESSKGDEDVYVLE